MAWEDASAGKGAATWGRTETLEGKERERGRDLGGGTRIGGDLGQELGMKHEGERAWEGQGLGRRAGVGREQKERTWEW